jgi:hypothetical protein
MKTPQSDLLRATMPTPGQLRELDVLEIIEHSLPAGYVLLHSVGYAQSQFQRAPVLGEIDVVIINQSGDVLLLEIKSGQLSFERDGIRKTYQGQHARRVDQQWQSQLTTVRRLLQQAQLAVTVLHCLVLPDCRVEGEVVGIPRDHILDATGYAQLGAWLQNLLPLGQRNEIAQRVVDFFRNQLDISPDMGATQEALSRATVQLATWVPRIQSPTGMFHIRATAGSGKSQLAIQLLQQAHAGKVRSLYVCFNRPLADRMAKLAPSSADLGSFHELCMDHYRRHVGEPDFTDGSIFATAAQRWFHDVENASPKYDLLVIDEAQDFEPLWINTLLCLLKPEGQLYVLEDPEQRLYERTPWSLPDTVTISCDDNFRTSRTLCAAINGLQLTENPIVAKSAYQGEWPEFSEVHDDASMLRATEQAVHALLQQGFTLADIVVLSFHGQHKAPLMQRDRLGPWSLSRFTGAFRDDQPVYTEGELRVESVYRFKGQSAPAVVMTDIDFTVWDDLNRRKLFVGLTRASMAAHLVLNIHSAGLLKQRLEGV